MKWTQFQDGDGDPILLNLELAVRVRGYDEAHTIIYFMKGDGPHGMTVKGSFTQIRDKLSAIAGVS